IAAMCGAGTQILHASAAPSPSVHQARRAVIHSHAVRSWLRTAGWFVVPTRIRGLRPRLYAGTRFAAPVILLHRVTREWYKARIPVPFASGALQMSPVSNKLAAGLLSSSEC